MSLINKPYKTVSIIAPYDKQGRILLQERVPKYGEEWGFFGGGIKPGETKEEAIVREIKEELNYNLENYYYVGEFSSDIVRGITSKRYLFLTELWDSPRNIIVHEGKGARLFTINEARTLKLMPGDDEGLSLIERALKKKLLL